MKPGEIRSLGEPRLPQYGTSLWTHTLFTSLHVSQLHSEAWTGKTLISHGPAQASEYPAIQVHRLRLQRREFGTSKQRAMFY